MEKEGISKEESYTERRALFRGIWDVTASTGATSSDDAESSPDRCSPALKAKVIKTLWMEDQKSDNRRKKHRIKNLRSVCNKILDFCNRQERDLYYAQFKAIDEAKETQAGLEGGTELNGAGSNKEPSAKKIKTKKESAGDLKNAGIKSHSRKDNRVMKNTANKIATDENDSPIVEDSDDDDLNASRSHKSISKETRRKVRKRASLRKASKSVSPKKSLRSYVKKRPRKKKRSCLSSKLKAKTSSKIKARISSKLKAETSSMIKT